MMQLRQPNVSKLCCRLLPFFEWLPLLNQKVIKADIVAGIIAGVLILPQSIALATIAGMPPEYGLYTSMFPVIIASLFGSSWHALSGPNTALVVMIAMAVGPYASIGTPDYIIYTLTLSFMVGCIQLTLALLRLGAIFNYFSHTAMVSLVTSVGVSIIVQQMGNFMGITMNMPEDIEDTLYQLWHSLYLANPYALLVGAVTLLSGVLCKRYSRWPHLIVAVVVGMLSAVLLNFLFGSATTGIDRLGVLDLKLLPLSAPDFSPQNFAEAAEGLIPAAFLIATMGLIQSAVIARAMSVHSGQHLNMNQEIAGQGLSNIAGSFLSCFPSCGSFNRSASNLESGAVTPLAGVISAFALAALVLLAAPVIAELPIPVMASVLFLVGWGLIKLPDIKKLLSLRGESRMVFLLVLGTALYGGLQNGVFWGAFLSIILYLKSVSTPEIALLFEEEAKQYLPEGVDKATGLHISGSLFFGSVQTLEQAFTDFASQDQHQSVLVIDGVFIQDIDKSAADAMIQEVKKRRAAGGDFFLWCRRNKLDVVMQQTGLLAALGADHIFYVDTD